MRERERQRAEGEGRGEEGRGGEQVEADVIVAERSEETCKSEEKARAGAARVTGESSGRANDRRSPRRVAIPLSRGHERTAIDQLYLPRAEL